jgi:hypothetical protein
MNRKEWWMAACALALAVGVGQAQEKPTKSSPKPAPQVLYIPPVPPVPELTLQLVGLEAVGCKAGIQAVQTAEAKGKCCTSCDNSTATNPAECCGECIKSKREVFASGCAESCTPTVKKVKKVKKPATQDYFIVAPPAPAMPAHIGPGIIYTPGPAIPASATTVMEFSIPDQPMMVFRAATKIKHAECASGCDTSVQQTKHESHGRIAIGFGLRLTGCSIPTVDVKTSGPLEIECGGCVARSEQMTLSMPGGTDWTVTALGNQVVVSGPSFKASCDSFARTTSEGLPGFVLRGNVHLHHGKSGMKVDLESDQVFLVLRDGKVEVHTVTAP